ncbi:hypothetical protein DFH06DRAFT_1410317 [Mycena polygramma]|nr:hypothetical protein DFH06DRAFT_1410317 [Mycena polygramma]
MPRHRLRNAISVIRDFHACTPTTSANSTSASTPQRTHPQRPTRTSSTSPPPFHLPHFPRRPHHPRLLHATLAHLSLSLDTTELFAPADSGRARVSSATMTSALPPTATPTPSAPTTPSAKRVSFPPSTTAALGFKSHSNSNSPASTPTSLVFSPDEEGTPTPSSSRPAPPSPALSRRTSLARSESRRHSGHSGSGGGLSASSPGSAPENRRDSAHAHSPSRGSGSKRTSRVLAGARHRLSRSISAADVDGTFVAAPESVPASVPASASSAAITDSTNAPITIRDFAYPRADARHAGLGPYVDFARNFGDGGYDHAEGEGEGSEDAGGEEEDELYYAEADVPPGLYRAQFPFAAIDGAEMDLAEGQLIHVLGSGAGAGWAVARARDPPLVRKEAGALEVNAMVGARTDAGRVWAEMWAQAQAQTNPSTTTMAATAAAPPPPTERRALVPDSYIVLVRGEGEREADAHARLLRYLDWVERERIRQEEDRFCSGVGS